jgi:hypothetical protein
MHGIPSPVELGSQKMVCSDLCQVKANQNNYSITTTYINSGFFLSRHIVFFYFKKSELNREAGRRKLHKT